MNEVYRTKTWTRDDEEHQLIAKIMTQVCPGEGGVTRVGILRDEDDIADEPFVVIEAMQTKPDDGDWFVQVSWTSVGSQQWETLEDMIEMLKFGLEISAEWDAAIAAEQCDDEMSDYIQRRESM